MRIEPAAAEELGALVDAWVDLAETQRRHGSHLASAANRGTVRPLLAHHVVEGTVLVARRGERGPGDRGQDAGTTTGASEAGGVIGFVNFSLEGGALASDVTRGIVHNLYVEAGSRGEGVGSALLEAAESALVERGADVIAIEALWDNEDARRLYERRGYAPHRVQFERTAGGDSDTEPEGDDAETATGKSDTHTKDGV